MEKLLERLIAAKSTADSGEAKCAKVLADFFSSAGIESKVEVWEKNRANITAALGSAGSRPAILFVSHLDVVPAESPNAFKPVRRNGKIFGRGSADMKAGMAAAAIAMAQIRKSKIKLKGDIIFAATAGEETDGCGVKRFMKSSGKIPALCGIIVPEPTDFHLVTAHRGLIWLEITTKGKSVHSSMPQLGINAIDSMRMFLDKLSKYKITSRTNKLLGKATLSVNQITGGSAPNIVPNYCRVCIDIRTLPGLNHEQIIRDIRKIFTQIPRLNADLKIARDSQALQTSENDIFVKQLKKLLKIRRAESVPFTTDAPYLTALNSPIVIFGPGNPKLCHQRIEYVDIKDLRKGVDLYKKIILQFLS